MSGTTRLNVSTDVTVTLNDLEEAGAVSVNNLNPGVGDELSFELSDPDGLQAAALNTWVLQQRTPGSGSWQRVPGFGGDGVSGTLAVRRVQEEQTGKQLRVSITYEDRRGTGKTAASEPTAAVTADPIANAPPRFRPGGDFSIPEGEAGRDVGTPLVVSDRDNDTLRFGIEAGEDHEFFTIDATSGQLSLLRAVDFEDQPAAGFYLVNVTLHDGKDADGNSEADPVVDATSGITIAVTDVEEDGVVTLSEDEPDTGTPLTATLEDGDGSVSGEEWQWARSANGRSNWLNISGATSSSYTPGTADEDFYLRASVEYTDNRGSGKRAEGVTKRPVPSVNRRPAFPDAETGERTVDENIRAGANIGAPVAAVDPERNRLTYTLSGTDAGAFDVVASSGQIRRKDALDFEAKESYSLTVDVHDGRDGEGNASTTTDATQDVTITVRNLEEPGTVTLGTATGVIQARVEVTAALSDPDGSVSELTWQWSQSPNGRTNWANVAGADTDKFTPPDGLQRRYIRATASYTDGQGSNKTTHGVSPRVAEPPPVNSAPVFPPTETGQRELPEDASGGDTIGVPVAATDLNAGDADVNNPLKYSLSGTDAASFTIDEGSAQLSLAQNVELDYETTRSYRVTVEVTDGADSLGDADSDAIDTRINITINLTDVNEAPEVSGDTAVTVDENLNRAIATYQGTDPERDTLAWSVNNEAFWISERGQLYFRTPPSFEESPTHNVTVTATDPGGLESNALAVAVTVTDVEEEGAVTISPPRGWEDTQFSATLEDGDGSLADQTWQWARSTNRSSWTDITGGTSDAYTALADDAANYLRVSVEYTDDRGSGKTAEAVLSVPVAAAADKPATNTAPAFAETAVTRSIGQGTAPGRSIGGALRATDADTDDVLVYSLSGTDAAAFEIDPATGQLRTKSVLDPAVKDTYTVTIDVHDGFDASYDPSDATDASIEVTITVTAVSRIVPGGIAVGGGGGGPAGPSPSDVEFEWNVTRDIEALDDGHGSPTGLWSDGVTLWLLENGSGADDAVYAYDLETGERVEEREFALDSTNRAPRGIWSDGVTAWVSDSGRDQLFAYNLATGERDEERELELPRDNRDARGIWSDGTTIWVLDGRADALFAYDLASGVLLAEYELAPANGDARGIWSDGVSVWVSDHGAKRLFAYRLPARPDEPAADDAERPTLERLRDLEFTKLSSASNNSPRGIWSDGDVMYVADESDGRIYSYNMPDAIDARLASLTLEGVDFGEFDSAQTEYEGAPGEGVTETTVTAEAMQRGASVVIAPADADAEAEGHQLTLAGLGEIAVTVTSAGGSRTKVYRVRLGDPAPARWPHCLRGAVAEGFNLVVYEGGTVEDLAACAASRNLTALYALHEGVYTSYILGAPPFVNEGFGALYADGVPAVTALVAASAGPSSEDPVGDIGLPRSWPECLRGEIVGGFSLVVYEGGSVEALADCAQGRGVTALYVLSGGTWVSHILGAPEFVNSAFAELFAGGVPAVTPLVAKSEGAR